MGDGRQGRSGKPRASGQPERQSYRSRSQRYCEARLYADERRGHQRRSYPQGAQRQEGRCHYRAGQGQGKRHQRLCTSAWLSGRLNRSDLWPDVHPRYRCDGVGSPWSGACGSQGKSFRACTGQQRSVCIYRL